MISLVVIILIIIALLLGMLGISNLLNNSKENRCLQGSNIKLLIGILLVDFVLLVLSYLDFYVEDMISFGVSLISILIFYSIKSGNKLSNKNKTPSGNYCGYTVENGKVYLSRNVVLLKEYLNNLKYGVIVIEVAYICIISKLIAKVVEAMKLKESIEYSTISCFTMMTLFVLLVNEIAQYLDGELPEVFQSNLKDEIKEEEVPEEKKTFLPLYNDYKKIWGRNILADYRPKTIRTEVEEEELLVDERVIKENSNKELEDIYLRLKKEYKITSQILNVLNDLLNREDIIIGNSNYEELAPVLFSYLETSIIKGKKVLVLAENNLYNNFKSRNTLKEWFSAWFTKLYKKSLRNISDFSEWINKNEWDILIATQNELIKYQEEFIKKIQEEQEDIKDIIILVINENSEEVAENILTLSVLTNILNTYFRIDKKKGESGAQYIILSNETSNLNESINKNLGISAKSVSLSDKEANNVYSIVWRTDSKNKYYTDIMDGIPKNNIGISNILSYLSWEQGYSKAEFIDQEELPYERYKAGVETAKKLLKERPIVKEKIKGVYEHFAKYNFISSIIKKDKQNLLYIYDKNQNFPVLLNKYSSLGEQEVFLNIVTPVYLLRDYFVDNIEYFTSSPIYRYTPKVESDKFKVASYLKEVLTNEKLDISEDDIRSELLTIQSKIGNIEEELVKLFEDIYSVDILKNDYLTVINKQVYNLENRRFEEKKFFKLNRAINESNYFQWFENYEVIDTGKTVYRLIPLEHIYQNYLPEQIHYFNGKSFKVDKIDKLNKRINISPTENDRFTIYRNKDVIDLLAVDKSENPVYSQKGSASYNIIKKVSKVDYDIKTLGYFEFLDDISMTNQSYSYRDLEDTEFYIREYKKSKMLTLSIEKKDGEIKNCDKVAVTLTVILNEMFKSLFPGNSRYLKLFPMVSENFFNEEIDEIFKVGYKAPETLSQILPAMVTVEKGNYTDILERMEENKLSVYILEDSHKDMGLLQAVQDNFEKILELVQDYLNWLNEDNSPEKGWNKNKFSTEEKKSYLKYGLDELSEYISLDEAREFLNEILGANEYTSARKRFYSTIINDESEDEFDKEYAYLREKIKERKK